MNYPWEVMVLAVVLMLNRVAIRFRWDRAFWGVQALDLAAAVYVGWFGLTGLEQVWVVRGIVVCLLLFHIVQNYSVRERIRLEARIDEQTRERIRMSRELR